jgi:glycosyltransferase involved in cell wall biosynthesis
MNNLSFKNNLKLERILISVVIAAFNGEKFILELLESIASQTHQVDEIVVCDDCSTDNTIKILDAFKLKYTHLNIRIIVNRHRLGITKNFSKAIKLSEGNLIFLADQDDIWHDNKVQTMLDAYTKGSASYIISDMNVLNITGGLEEFTWAELMENNYGITKSHVMNGCAVVATKKFLRSCLPVPYGKGHDVWFAYCAKRLKTRVFLDKPLMNYRISPQGVTSYKFVDNLKLSKKGVGIQINNNLKTLINAEDKLMLVIIKSLMHLYFVSVAIKFKLFKKSSFTIRRNNHGRQ